MEVNCSRSAQYHNWRREEKKTTHTRQYGFILSAAFQTSAAKFLGVLRVRAAEPAIAGGGERFELRHRPKTLTYVALQSALVITYN